jgi:sulfonate transport system substrate-binding protein
MMMGRQLVRRGLLAGLVAMAVGTAARADEVLRLDFAYYNPVSLVLKDRHWVEDAVGPGVRVEWVQSAGSNKALEFLRGRSLDFGSTAGSAALLGRANGTPVRAIYVYGQMEWTALLTRADSPIRTVADLRGKRVAATPGTDPGIFLLRALDAAGLSRADITLVPLQHADGRLALDRGDVDAWAGLDPFMALAEVQNHDRLFFRDRALVTPGTLLVREAYAAEHPERVVQVLAAYERGRAWARTNPDALAELLAAAAKLPIEVARLQLSRDDFSTAVLGAEQRASIGATARVLKGSGSVSEGADLDRAAAELIDTGFTDKLATP